LKRDEALGRRVRGILLVAAGGALGSVARYLLSGWVLHHTAQWRFPLGTFLVNILGCLAVGILGALVVKHDFLSPEARLLLFTGIAGGFTTFSAFGLETFHLLRRGEVLVAGGYVASSLVVGLLVLWAGYALISARA
jgi:fluoride exporter